MSAVILTTMVLLSYAMPRFGARLAAQLGLGRLAKTALALNLGTAFFLSPIVVAGRLSGRTRVGFIAALVVAIGVAAFVWRREGRPAGRRWHARWAPRAIALVAAGVGVSVLLRAGRDATLPLPHGLMVGGAIVAAAVAVALFWGLGPPVGAAPRLSRAFSLALFGTLGVVVFIALRYGIHDENLLFGHISIAQQLVVGEFPPHVPWAPGHFFRYHWGFDVLAAAGVMGLGISARVAIDLVVCFLAVSLAWAVAAVADEAGGSPAAAILAVFFGSGLAFWLLLFFEPMTLVCLAQNADSCGVTTFPPQISNFFQHAVSIGAPLFFTWLLLAPRLHLSRAQPALAASILPLLLSLGVGQIVFFTIGTLAALTAAPLWWDKRQARQGWPWLIGVSSVALGLLVASGGMLSFSPDYDPGAVQLRWPPGFPEGGGLSGGLYYQLVNQGLGLLLLPVFIWEALRRRRPMVLMLTAFSIGGLLVPQLFSYGHSWDIIKFPSAAAFTLSLLAVIVVYPRLQGGGGWRAARLGFWLLLTPSGVVWAAHLILPLPYAMRTTNPGGYNPEPNAWAAGRWLIAQGYRPEQVILGLPHEVGARLLRDRGLSIANHDEALMGLGFAAEWREALVRVYEAAYEDMDPAALQKLGVRWVVIREDQLAKLKPAARQALADPRRFQRGTRIQVGPPEAALTIWWNLAYPRPPALAAGR